LSFALRINEDFDVEKLETVLRGKRRRISPAAPHPPRLAKNQIFAPEMSKLVLKELDTILKITVNHWFKFEFEHMSDIS
jgi:hypothetical protein